VAVELVIRKIKVLYAGEWYYQVHRAQRAIHLRLVVVRVGPVSARSTRTNGFRSIVRDSVEVTCDEGLAHSEIIMIIAWGRQSSNRNGFRRRSLSRANPSKGVRIAVTPACASSCCTIVQVLHKIRQISPAAPDSLSPLDATQSAPPMFDDHSRH